MSTSIEIVIPVLNEQQALPPSIGTLHGFLTRELSCYAWRILIADNGSTDATPDVARQLSHRYDRVGWSRLEQRGRGRALRAAWLASDADIVSYMDVDLSTDLACFPKLLEAIDEGSDIAIGSRLKKGARVIARPLTRELTSRSYSLIFRTMFLTRFQDAQCGFKALSQRAAQDIVPLVRDQGWFFDTELLILAEKNGYSIKEVPVEWTDDPDSRVRIINTAYGDLKGLLRLRFGGLRKASALLSSSPESVEN